MGNPKIIMLVVLLAAVAFFVNYWQGALAALVQTSPNLPPPVVANPQPTSTPSPPIPVANTVPAKTVTPTPELGKRSRITPDDGANQIVYGSIKLSANMMSELIVQPGQNVRWSPVENVAYDYFVDGELKHHFAARGSDALPNPMLKFPPNGHKAGFRLSPGQGLESISFVYVKYFSKEAPENWWETALEAARRKNQ